MVLPAFGLQKSQPPVPNSPKGFDKQYKNVFKGYEKANNVFKPYRKDNELELMERLRTFAIPEHWFTDVFGPEQGSTFAREYEDRLRGFESATIREFRRVIGNSSAQVNTRLVRANTDLTLVRSGPTSLVPLPPVILGSPIEARAKGVLGVLR
jgi:hypothetical protein